MDAAGNQIEAKLNKSLDELIKESQQQSWGGRSGGGGRGGDRGQGRGRGGSRPDGRRRKDDAMDIDDAADGRRRRVDTSILRPKGGVSKGGNRRSGGSDSVPAGNMNKAWRHDLHEDDGPAKPRVASSGRDRGSAPVAKMTVVRITNLPGSVSGQDMAELINMVDKPLSMQLKFTDDGTQTFEANMASEAAAREVAKQYTDCALDGHALKIQVGGTHKKTVLSSGLQVEKLRSAPSGGAAPVSAGVRGARGKGTVQRGKMRAFS